ncbi:hypothetical protein DACRYDRAFT_102888 [Dacryopinax primogenitus]|uniref:Uncharacterized protein n=1 Tax=Dacryopinax primogenitus (strain DJM 731) TaxID=1858805 RepID=M5GGR2_DACPD|nr:uncharacterized protein DACRYDRAFT_102888 [Dacryopinax primogenitus]EJU05933.1 hypothetical protein DACRYDRAFT_102888 [Dacryopinax primogenitus]
MLDSDLAFLDPLYGSRPNWQQCILATLEYAPAALRDNEAAIKSLTERIDASSQQIIVLHKKTNREHKDFAKLQNSAGRRLWVKIKHGGKKDAVEKKLEKEEREFLEALEQEQAAEEVRAAMQTEKDSLASKVCSPSVRGRRI